MDSLFLALFAQQQPAAPDPRASTIQLVGMMAIMGLMFYFAIFRPQQKKAREHDKLMKSLKRGDKVITSGGICGIIVNVKDRTVVIRSEDTKIELLRSSVTEIIERAESTAAATPAS